MTMFAPSEDAIRSKAYDLWLEGGQVDGRDKDDWYRATTLLAGRGTEPAAVSRTGDAVSTVQTMAESMLGAAAVAVDAAVHVVEGLIGSVVSKVASPGHDVTPVAKTPESVSSEALGSAERKLQIEADKRIRDAAVKAGKS